MPTFIHYTDIDYHLHVSGSVLCSADNIVNKIELSTSRSSQPIMEGRKQELYHKAMG